MTSPLVWPPSIQEARLDADTLVIQAPASLLMQEQVADRDRNHWTHHWVIDTRRLACLSQFGDYIILVDTGGVATQEDGSRRLEASVMAAIFSTRAPHSLWDMDHILSVDIDDARGRMAVAMVDGGLVIIEFV